MTAISTSFSSSFYSPAPVVAPATLYAFTGQPVRPAPPAPVQEVMLYEIDCISRECLLYEYFSSRLLKWAHHGYPPKRLREDLYRHSFR